MPSSTAGTWTSITFQHNGLSKEVYTKPSGDLFYRLQTVTYPNGKQINLHYNAGKLISIDTVMGSVATSLLALEYNGAGGLLSKATDSRTGSYRNYTTTSGELDSASQINSASAEWSYAYSNINNQSFLQTVQAKDPQGILRNALVDYEAGTARAHSMTDARGTTRTYEYMASGGAIVSWWLEAETSLCDAVGRIKTNISTAGDITSFTYGTVDPSVITSVTKPNGNVVSGPTDSHGNLTRVSFTYGNHDDFAWEYPSTSAPLGRVASMTEFNSINSGKPPTALEYYGDGDSNGQPNFLKKVTYPNLESFTFTYTSLGNVKTVVGPNTSWTFQYDHDSQGASQPERFGLPYSIQDGSATAGSPNTTWYTYDLGGRLTSVRDPVGNVASITPNSYGQTAAISMPLNRALSIAYSVNGKSAQSATLSGLGQPVALFQNIYGPESEPISSVDPNSIPNTVAFNPTFDFSNLVNGNNNQMHSVSTSPLARSYTTLFGSGAKKLTNTDVFDVNGNLSNSFGLEDGWSMYVSPNFSDPDMPSGYHFTQGNGYADINLLYDAFARVNDTNVSGNIVGSPQTVVDNGVQHHITYDNEDKPLAITTSNGTYGGTQTVSYDYNPDGTRQHMYVQLVDADGGYYAGQGYDSVTYSYSYDTGGRVTSIVVSYHNFGGGNGPIITRADYAYDANGRVISVRTPQADTFYAYDALGQMTDLFNVSPDSGRDTGAPSAYLFNDPDTAGHPGLVHSISSAFSSMTYDALGNRLHANIAAEVAKGTPSTYGVGSVDFTYDPGGRLLTETWVGFGATTTLSHLYDNGDNLIKLRGKTWTLDQLTDQPIGAASLPGYSALTFNASGQESVGNSINYYYNAQGNIGQAKGTSVDSAIINVQGIFDQRPSYDADGRRGYQSFSFTNYAPASHDEVYYYDGNAIVCRWAGKWNGSNANADFNGAVSDLGNPAAPDPYVLYLWGPTGPVVEFDAAGSAKALCYDPQGSCVNTCDAFNFGSKPLFYDGYGEPVWPYTGYAVDEKQRSMRQPLQYKGQAGYYTDVHTNLCYCIARYYDPRSGRWLTRDPIGLEGGVNVYAYCGGNPVMLWDPNGLDVGAPTGCWGYEDCIPVWGSGRDAIHEYQTGKWGWGIFHSVLALTDIVGIKALVSGGIKVLGKVSAKAAVKSLAKDGLKVAAKEALHDAGVWKQGSSTWSATRKWLLKKGIAEANAPAHHWLIAQNSKFGKQVPNYIKNQPWNLMNLSSNALHVAIHGKGEYALNPLQRILKGTPFWVKPVSLSATGHGVSHFVHR